MIKLRKVVALIFVILGLCGLASCKTGTGTDDPNKDQPITYPYMNYMNQTVYATSKVDSLDVGTFKSQGSDKVDNVVTSSTTTFNNKPYEGLVFTMKETAVLNSVTFTVTAEEDIVYSPGVYGHMTSPASNLSMFSYKCGDPGKLKAGESKTVTMTYGNGTSFILANGKEATWDSWAGASESDRRFAIFVMVWKDDGSYTHKLLNDYTKDSLFKISNVSFNFA